MNYPDLIKWIFEFVYEHWILTFLFILALRRFSIFTINLSDKKGDTNVKSSPDSCVKCYTMFLPFLLIKIDVFS